MWESPVISFSHYIRWCIPLTYAKENITKAFQKCGIISFNPQTVLGDLPNLKSRSHQPGPSESTLPLDKSLYTKCQIRQQTNQALAFLKEASYGDICRLIVKFFHTAEYMTTADIANAQAQKLREALEEIPPTSEKKNYHQMRALPDSGVMTGGTIMRTMEEQDRKDQEKAVQKVAKGVARTRTRTRTQKVTNHQLEGP